MAERAEYVEIRDRWGEVLMIDGDGNVHPLDPGRHVGDLTRRPCANRGCQAVYRKVQP